ncbi:hypothetical protein WICMUC_000263 [Wickerhamomyces mucosus]|uniref:Uncharacterized protein n=1 Tax=Wickerhamomyces mucosus TaxID=1378264 RepID=A0A9P8PZQ3_9ASCO|nr:hypothetical protein WICMUC_000263 [Wickerhamomyces mucosus]
MVIANAIPIPQDRILQTTTNDHQSSKIWCNTPSLQCVIDQKRISSSNTPGLSFSSSSDSSLSLHSMSNEFSLPKESYCFNHPLDSKFQSFNPRFNSLYDDSDNDSLNIDDDEDGDEYELSMSFNQSSMKDYEDEHTTFEEIDENFFTSSLVRSVSAIEITNRCKEPQSINSFVSHLSNSLKKLTISTAKLMYSNDDFFLNQPRSTDDKLPETKNYNNKLSQSPPPPQEKELKTFKVFASSPEEISVQKTRESRINSQFLRLYAYETSSRSKGLLQDISKYDDDRIYNKKQEIPSNLSEKIKFSMCVREKLWEKVILPARNDSSNLGTVEYINENDIVNKSNSNKQNDCLLKPWVKLTDFKLLDHFNTFSPRGTLQKGKIQYTVKGWTNKKWIAQT